MKNNTTIRQHNNTTTQSIMILTDLWNGILLGLALSLAAGPIFFMLVQIGIERGVLPGLALSAGVLLSDVLYVSVVYMGVGWLSSIPNFKLYMGVIGGLILICFGLATILSKYKPPKKIEVSAKNYLGYFLKGMAINIFNPFVFFLWIGVTGTMIEREMSINRSIAYFLAIIITVAITDFIKLLLANKIRDYMQPKHFQRMRYIAGSGLILFGLILFIRVVM